MKQSGYGSNLFQSQCRPHGHEQLGHCGHGKFGMNVFFFQL